MSWFESTPESEALLAEERLVLAATEAVHDAMTAAGINGQQLAEMLMVRPSEISQRLSGRRNLTMRSLAQMLHALGAQADIVLKQVVDAGTEPWAENGQSPAAKRDSTCKAALAEDLNEIRIESKWSLDAATLLTFGTDQPMIWTRATEYTAMESHYKSAGHLFDDFKPVDDDSEQESVGCS